MRGENEPAAGGGSDVDGDSFEDARVEPIQPGERDTPSPKVSALAPGWTKRLSARGKAGRTLLIALVVITALAVLVPRAAFHLPPQIARLLTPPPTRRPTPTPFSTGALERIPLTAIPGAGVSVALSDLAPAPRDPATAFVCAHPQNAGPISGFVSGAIALWGTHNAGQTWSPVPLPAVTGYYCEVDAAADGSPRLVMNIGNSVRRQNTLPCAQIRFLLSDDDGATWRAITHIPLALAGGFCWMLVTAKHLFLTGLGGLERSDDDGQTWQRADHGLPDGAAWNAQLLDATGEALVTTTNGPIGPDTLGGLWVTHDAGANWRRVESLTWPTPPPGSVPIEELLTEAPLGELARAPQACHCAVGLSYPDGISPSPIATGMHVYLSRDLAQWTPLPPLPVAGTSAERSGIYQVLGLTGDGRLLVVGANREDVFSESSFAPGEHHAPQLWAWNTHTGRWELAPTQLPCQDLQACFNTNRVSNSPPNDVSIRLDGSGRPTGIALWFWFSPFENRPPVITWYRLSIPLS